MATVSVVRPSGLIRLSTLTGTGKNKVLHSALLFILRNKHRERHDSSIDSILFLCLSNVHQSFLNLSVYICSTCTMYPSPPKQGIHEEPMYTHTRLVVYADLASPLCCDFIFFLNSSQGSQLISRVEASWTLHPHLLSHVHPTNLHRGLVQGLIGGSMLAACAFFAAWRVATSSSIL
uniref:Uncharacterized protein n=1 Tax=Minutocellus polymorphus TaxID=265543 RepID=A0A7S0APM5_9STRA